MDEDISSKKKKVDFSKFEEDAFNVMSPRVGTTSTLSYLRRLTQDERRGVYELAAGWICCLLFVVGAISMVVGCITMPLSNRKTIKALKKVTEDNSTLSGALAVHLKAANSEERNLFLFGLISTALGAAGLRLVLNPFIRRRWRYCFIACCAIVSLLLILDVCSFNFLNDTSTTNGNSTGSLDDLFEEILATRPIHLAEFDDAMECSGFSVCCVYNTSEVNDTSAMSSYWNTHCALLLPDGTLQDRGKNDVTDTFLTECQMDGVPQLDVNASTTAAPKRHAVACSAKIYGVLSLVSYFSFLAQIGLCIFCIVAAGFMFTSTVYVKDSGNSDDTIVVDQAH